MIFNYRGYYWDNLVIFARQLVSWIEVHKRNKYHYTKKWHVK